MARRGPRRPRQPRSARAYVLEETSPPEILESKRRTRELLRYHWDYHSELAFQRAQIEHELLDALRQGSIRDFSFDNWQRAVKYRYALHPLSTAGSLSSVGGRFNVGDIDRQHFPTFPALYLASNKDTALQETLGQPPSPVRSLTAREMALSNPQSETIVSVSGTLEAVLDLRSARALQPFIRLVRNFSLSSNLRKEAARLKLRAPTISTTASHLRKTILDTNWRLAPMVYDIPANGQILGQLVRLAGIEGVLYPSTLTGKDCLAIYPFNFESSTAYVQLDDSAPHPDVPARLDATNWRVSDLRSDEVISKP